MDSPHDQQQSALLSRIIANINKLNHNIRQVNKRLETINKSTEEVALTANMWSGYNESVQIYLNSTKGQLSKK
ncbi:DASH complex subunit Dad4 [Sporodiniella umbellata]|nr:DASH complex subunit Dad4 [Sporodiniella umbellata]